MRGRGGVSKFTELCESSNWLQWFFLRMPSFAVRPNPFRRDSLLWSNGLPDCFFFYSTTLDSLCSESHVVVIFRRPNIKFYWDTPVGRFSRGYHRTQQGPLALQQSHKSSVAHPRLILEDVLGHPLLTRRCRRFASPVAAVARSCSSH